MVASQGGGEGFMLEVERIPGQPRVEREVGRPGPRVHVFQADRLDERRVEAEDTADQQSEVVAREAFGAREMEQAAEVALDEAGGRAGEVGGVDRAAEPERVC